MKQFLPILIVIQCFTVTVNAQFHYDSKPLPSNQKRSSFIPNKIHTKYSPSLTQFTAPAPGTQVSEEKLKELKKSVVPKPRLKQSSAISDTARKPELLLGMLGNSYAQSVPNDNSFAINRKEQLLSVINTNVFAYDIKNDSLLYQVSLQSFSSELTQANSHKYDPRVIYDPEADRFIVVFLNGSIYQESKIVVAFSKGPDLMDGFNLYALEGNPLDNDTWSDYPHISVSKDDLFICMNTFYNGSRNNSGYVESTIRQVGKAEGYANLPLLQFYYNNISLNKKNLFNFTGLQGVPLPLADEAYFMSNRNLDSINDSLFIVKVEGNLKGATPRLSLKTVYSKTPYGLPPYAHQKGGHFFDCNDSRVQGGFVAHNKLQFVGNTVNSQGYSAIYHGIYDLNLNRDSAYFRILSGDTLDFGYPNISYTGKSRWEDEAIITFNKTGINANAGFASIFFDNDHKYSSPLIINDGESHVDIFFPDKYERWGDYTGGQMAYGENGIVWASGYHSKTNKRPGTWIAKLRSPSYKNEAIAYPKAKELNSYPNPTTDIFSVDLLVEEEGNYHFTLISSEGKVIEDQELLNQYLLTGKYSFSFSTKNLRNGIYYLYIDNDKGERIKEGRVVKI